MFRLIAILIFGLLANTQAHAHSKSISFSQIEWRGDALKLTFTAPDRTITLLPAVATLGLSAALQEHLTQHISVADCTREQNFTARTAAQGYKSFTANFICADKQTITIHNHAFFNFAASHINFARIGAQEILFTTTSRSFTLTRNGEQINTQSQSAFPNYLKLGAQHIASGADHIAFVFCLLLLATSRRQILILISGFTLGHSITLALAALNILAPTSAVIEAIIGLSIALVAAETILARQDLMARVGIATAALFLLAALAALTTSTNLPPLAWVGLAGFIAAYGLFIRHPADTHTAAPLLTLLFGLFHGLGFGGALGEIGLPQEQIIRALLGFNLGVELGQLAIVAIMFALVAVAQKLNSPKLIPATTAKDIAACILTAYGVFLFATRSIL